MGKISKFDMHKYVARIIELKDKGLNQVEIAKELGKTKACIASICRSKKITGWPEGSAARNQQGFRNPNYGNGRSRATIGRTAKRVLIEDDRDLFTCERCDKRNDIELPRHHKNRDVRDNSPDNLEVLCHSCHNLEHMPERVRTPFGTFSS